MRIRRIIAFACGLGLLLVPTLATAADARPPSPGGCHLQLDDGLRVIECYY
jgi:hypothetical protein